MSGFSPIDASAAPLGASEIRRLPNISRKSAATRGIYRQRTKKVVLQQTEAEVAAKAKRREENKAKHEEALETAFKKIWTIAEELAEELGDHPPTYYYQRLMQQSKTASSSRNVNPWNAFLSKETKKLNDGKLALPPE